MEVKFNAARLALIRRARPGCNLDNLSDVTFEFDNDGNVIDCYTTEPATGLHAGSGLLALYAMAQREREQRLQGASAVIIPFPGGANA